MLWARLLDHLIVSRNAGIENIVFILKSNNGRSQYMDMDMEYCLISCVNPAIYKKDSNTESKIEALDELIIILSIQFRNEIESHIHYFISR